MIDLQYYSSDCILSNSVSFSFQVEQGMQNHQGLNFWVVVMEKKSVDFILQNHQSPNFWVGVTEKKSVDRILFKNCICKSLNIV